MIEFPVRVLGRFVTRDYNGLARRKLLAYLNSDPTAYSPSQTASSISRTGRSRPHTTPRTSPPQTPPQTTPTHATKGRPTTVHGVRTRIVLGSQKLKDLGTKHSIPLSSIVSLEPLQTTRSCQSLLQCVYTISQGRVEIVVYDLHDPAALVKFLRYFEDIKGKSRTQSSKIASKLSRNTGQQRNKKTNNTKPYWSSDADTPRLRSKLTSSPQTTRNNVDVSPAILPSVISPRSGLHRPPHDKQPTNTNKNESEVSNIESDRPSTRHSRTSRPLARCDPYSLRFASGSSTTSSSSSIDVMPRLTPHVDPPPVMPIRSAPPPPPPIRRPQTTLSPNIRTEKSPPTLHRQRTTPPRLQTTPQSKQAPPTSGRVHAAVKKHELDTLVYQSQERQRKQTISAGNGISLQPEISNPPLHRPVVYSSRHEKPRAQPCHPHIRNYNHGDIVTEIGHPQHDPGTGKGAPGKPRREDVRQALRSLDRVLSRHEELSRHPADSSASNWPSSSEEETPAVLGQEADEDSGVVLRIDRKQNARAIESRRAASVGDNGEIYDKGGTSEERAVSQVTWEEGNRDINPDTDRVHDDVDQTSTQGQYRRGSAMSMKRSRRREDRTERTDDSSRWDEHYVARISVGGGGGEEGESGGREGGGEGEESGGGDRRGEGGYDHFERARESNMQFLKQDEIRINTHGNQSRLIRRPPSTGSEYSPPTQQQRYPEPNGFHPRFARGENYTSPGYSPASRVDDENNDRVYAFHTGNQTHFRDQSEPGRQSRASLDDHGCIMGRSERRLSNGHPCENTCNDEDAEDDVTGAEVLNVISNEFTRYPGRKKSRSTTSAMSPVSQCSAMKSTSLANHSSVTHRRKPRTVSWMDVECEPNKRDIVDATVNGHPLLLGVQTTVPATSSVAVVGSVVADSNVEVKRYATACTQSLPSGRGSVEEADFLGESARNGSVEVATSPPLDYQRRPLSHAHNTEDRLRTTVEHLASDVMQLKLMLAPVSPSYNSPVVTHHQATPLLRNTPRSPGVSPRSPHPAFAYPDTPRSYPVNDPGTLVFSETPGPTVECLSDRHALLNRKLRASMSSLQRLAMQESLSNLRGAVHRTVTTAEVGARRRPPQDNTVYPVRLSLNSFGEPRCANGRRPPPMVPPTTPTDHHAQRVDEACVARAYSHESTRTGEHLSSTQHRTNGFYSHEAPSMRSRRGFATDMSMKHRSKSCERY